MSKLENIVIDIVEYALEVVEGFEHHLFLVAYFYIIIVVLKTYL